MTKFILNYNCKITQNISISKTFFQITLSIRFQFPDTLSDCTFFSKRTAFSTTLSVLTHNGMAAWRRGGLHKC